MMKVKHLLLLLCLFALSLSTVRVVPRSLAMPNVYVYPEAISYEPSESFTVEVRISGAENVFAWEFYLFWNGTVLNETSVAEGNFLKGLENASTYFVQKIYQNQSDRDYVLLACTRLGSGISGVSGSGTLATITFLVEKKGETVLDLVDTKLRDSVPNPIDHTSTDGLFSNTAGFPRASFTYSPVKADINQTITFDASNSNDTNPGGFIVKYSWDFGDGATANETGTITYHAYKEGGSYPVTLTVTDNDGWNTSVTHDVKVRFTYDIMVVSVTESQETATIGDVVTITVKIGNEGSSDVSGVSVTVYYDGTPVGPAQTVTSLVSGQNKTLTFSWNTAGVSKGSYRIKAVANPVPSETNTGDNTKFGGTVDLTEPPQFPWLYVGGGIAAAGVVAVLGALFFRRRGGKSSS